MLTSPPHRVITHTVLGIFSLFIPVIGLFSHLLFHSILLTFCTPLDVSLLHSNLTNLASVFESKDSFPLSGGGETNYFFCSSPLFLPLCVIPFSFDPASIHPLGLRPFFLFSCFSLVSSRPFSAKQGGGD